MAKVTVQNLPDHTYSQLLTASPHAFLADEPPEAGGEGLGPGPYELLLWALGSCTSMTLLMYARRKGWEVAEISVELSFNRIHAQDSEDVEADSGRIELIHRDILLRGDISEEQKERLLEIAQRTPMSKTLSGGTRVIDSIAVAT